MLHRTNTGLDCVAYDPAFSWGVIQVRTAGSGPPLQNKVRNYKYTEGLNIPALKSLPGTKCFISQGTDCGHLPLTSIAQVGLSTLLGVHSLNLSYSLGNATVKPRTTSQSVMLFLRAIRFSEELRKEGRVKCRQT